MKARIGIHNLTLWLGLPNRSIHKCIQISLGLASFVQPLLAYSQNICAMEGDSPFADQLGLACGTSLRYAPMIAEEMPIKTVRIAFHVMADDNGAHNFQDTDEHRNWLRAVVAQANVKLGNTGPLIYGTTPFIQDTRIRIHLEQIYFHYSSTYYSWPANTQMFDTWVCQDPDATGYTEDATYNVEHIFLRGDDDLTDPYSVGGTQWGISTGCQTQSNSDYLGRQGWISAGGWYAFFMSNLPGEYWMVSGNLIHELGHAMGLWHNSTFQCDECTDNDQASGACPPIAVCNNYMGREYHSWNRSNPDPGFSQCQLGIMHFCLDGNVPSRTSYRIVLQDHCTYHADETITITAANRVWEDSRKLKGDLVVETGATLTVKCRVHMPYGSKVVVKPGGRLIIDEGLFTNVCDQFWSGIQVWGDNSSDQYGATVNGQYRDFAHQGYVELRNGGSIEHSRCAITLQQTGTSDTHGGVVRSYGGVFRNNRRAVEFLGYQNTLQGNSGVNANNRSFFHRTFFTVDDDYRGGNDFYAHVSMWDVSGVTFSGCKFENRQTSITQSAYLGYGIDAGNSKFIVKAACNGPGPNTNPCAEIYVEPSTFTGLDHGIHASNGFSVRAFQVEDAVFTDNVCGIYSNGVVGFKVTNSKFYVGGNAVDLNSPFETTWLGRHRGIFSTEGFGFIIDDNEVHQSGSNLTEGIVIGYSRDHNDMLFGNSGWGLESAFIGEGTCASTTARQSIGFYFQCNKNNDNEVNFWSRRVDLDPNTQDQTIRTNQGSMTRAADNAFDRDAGRLDFKNTNLDNNVNYWWRAPEVPYKPLYTSAGINTISGAYAGTNNCQSRRAPYYPYPHPSIAGGHKSSLLQHKLDHANNWFLYKQLLDGGHTDEVLEDLQANWSQGAWAMRDYLLGLSPYLSMDAMKQAMIKPDFPAAMKAEVCIANPDVTQTEGFMGWLRTECPNAPGESLLETIEASWNTKTYRTQLEAALAYDHAEMTQSANLLLQYHQSDTIEHVDSLRAVWQLIRTPAARYAEALTYLQKQQFTQAITVVESIPFEHDLRDKEESERQHMLDLITAFQGIFNGGRNYAKMSPGDITAIESIIGDHHDRATNWAQNILCWHHGHCKGPWTGGEMGDNKPKSRILATSNAPKPEQVYLRLYPNPSTNWTTAEIDLASEPNNAAILVQDITGRVLQRLIVGSRQTQLILDSRTLSPGSYRVELMNGGELLQTQTLIIRQ